MIMGRNLHPLTEYVNRRLQELNTRHGSFRRVNSWPSNVQRGVGLISFFVAKILEFDNLFFYFGVEVINFFLNFCRIFDCTYNLAVVFNVVQ